MGLLSALNTSVSGMAAQSAYLNGVGDNIANSNTTGYKEASVEFETLLGAQTPGSYQSGGVLAQNTYQVTGQGNITSTTTSTNLAIQGGGFFAVTSGGSGNTFLTRAGSFAADPSGNLVNTAGYTLMGYAVEPSGQTSPTLSAVNVASSKLEASATTSATITGNLPSADASGTIETGTSFPVYDDLGAATNVTMSYTDNGSNGWTATAKNSSGTVLGTATLTFDPSSGALSSGSPMTLTIPSSAGSTSSNTISLDLSAVTQLAGSFGNTTVANGNAPSELASVAISSNGTLTGTFASGATAALYKIPVATVPSPDSLTSINGDVYNTNQQSGAITFNTPGTGPAGVIDSDSLEGSTVDLATQLTDMIVAQSSYEANSKVLQTVADLLSKLNQIQTS